jgi:hypothetical protein
MDHADSPASDDVPQADGALQDPVAPAAGPVESDLALGYEAAVPWLQQPLWEQTPRDGVAAASDR